MSARLQMQQIPEFLARYNGDHPDEDNDLLARRERIRREGKLQITDLCAGALTPLPDKPRRRCVY